METNLEFPYCYSTTPDGGALATIASPGVKIHVRYDADHCIIGARIIVDGTERELSNAAAQSLAFLR
jgi:hypothetical protein